MPSFSFPAPSRRALPVIFNSKCLGRVQEATGWTRETVVKANLIVSCPGKLP
ncbi:hypothetical protein M408DRAFT_292255 [Serendipita vermifera MAFF 305830]|uniref:Uncharacterized protein n=1 Tax=Serendipita vermifera MAFF 305830 TaxID=933852 RepID=A0A0C3ASJ7_SERVB|nr:hypothetical protein M408DRAFT_292255 [Serendipita vermifera MAFF 305830]